MQKKASNIYLIQVHAKFTTMSMMTIEMRTEMEKWLLAFARKDPGSEYAKPDLEKVNTTPPRSRQPTPSIDSPRYVMTAQLEQASQTSRHHAWKLLPSRANTLISSAWKINLTRPSPTTLQCQAIRSYRTWVRHWREKQRSSSRSSQSQITITKLPAKFWQTVSACLK